MSDEWQEYVKDLRTVCKYGLKCYQKNPEHHANFKHPPTPRNLKNNRNKHRFSPYQRKDKPSPKANLDTVEPDSNEGSAATTVEDSKPRNSKEKDCEPTNIKEVDNEAAVNYIETDDGKQDESNIFKDAEDKISIKEQFLAQDITFYGCKEHEVIKELFLVDMPLDFYKFYECLNENNAIDKVLSSVNLELIGPYDLLQGKLPIVEDKEQYLAHWRFFYDPPEFQSVLKRKGKSEYHIGYFRDDPNEKPVFLACNDSSKGYHIKPLADNIFATVYLYLQNEKKTSPFTAIMCQKLMQKLKKYADENNFSLEEYDIKKRQTKIVTKAFHGAGIVVPYNKKTQLGYRHLVENDATLKKLFVKLEAAKSPAEKDSILSELQPVITYASIAVDECDFGTGLEAGIALFCSGLTELEPSALSSLTAAYTVLNREVFSKVIQAHLKYRRKGPNMSVLHLIDK